MINPGTFIYYTKDNKKHYGQIISVDTVNNKYTISLLGIGTTLILDEEDIELA